MLMDDPDIGAPAWEVLALRYAERDARRAANFVGGDPHDAPMPMAYYLWVLRGGGRTMVVDTGFGADMAAKRHRRLLRHPAEALAAVGVDAARVDDVIVTICRTRRCASPPAGAWAASLSAAPTSPTT
jgi:glyoxylase-like metal-dependent hydrolase (beta-lactamase superfamily II)